MFQTELRIFEGASGPRVAVFGRQSGTQLTFGRTHVAGADQLIAGTDTQVQIPGSLLFKREAECWWFVAES